MKEYRSKSTQCVHSGTAVDRHFKGLNSPIYTSTAFDYLDSESKYYQRYFNTPNQEVLVKKLCDLENAEDGIIFSSGMAAISSTLLSLLNAGDHALFQTDIYGGTWSFLTRDLVKYGVECEFIDTTNLQKIEESLKTNTKILYFESPSNPLLRINDLKEINKIAKKRGILTIIDNTFATPINQNPIDFGIDVVLHSATKYLSGHSDIQSGAVVSSTSIIDKIKHTAINLGGSLNAQSCYLLERSLKTLELRVGRQTENASEIAAFLKDHPKVKKVYYPGLKDHPGHQIAASQMKSFGAMLSFELQSLETENFLKCMRLIRPALSLGGVESTACVPAQTSHAKMSREERAEIGISEGLIRLSVGIEDKDELIEDLEGTLHTV